MKIAAFSICGLRRASAPFSPSALSEAHQQMGVFFEMKVAMAIFLGGVLVTGGSSAKLYKVLLGSFS
jgi:ribose transport system permease protein